MPRSVQLLVTLLWVMFCLGMVSVISVALGVDLPGSLPPTAARLVLLVGVGVTGACAWGIERQRRWAFPLLWCLLVGDVVLGLVERDLLSLLVVLLLLVLLLTSNSRSYRSWLRTARPTGTTGTA